jgi:hypothetical protein
MKLMMKTISRRWCWREERRGEVVPHERCMRAEKLTHISLYIYTVVDITYIYIMCFEQFARKNRHSGLPQDTKFY